MEASAKNGQERPSREDEERSRKPEESEEVNAEEQSEESSGSKLPGVKAIGWGFVLLILAGYFVWLCEQMGGGTATGAAPMLGVLAASVVGIAAAVIAFAVSRNDKGKER